MTPKRSDVRDKLGSEIRRSQYQCVEAGTSEESTRLTLAGLDGVRNKVQSSLMRGPEGALYIPLSEERGRGKRGCSPRVEVGS